MPPRAGMNYYGLLALVLACLVSSVIVKGQELFSSVFFMVAYAAMSFVLVIGSRNEETHRIDIFLGIILLLSVGFMSTEILIDMITNNYTGQFPFEIAIVAALDFTSVSFMREGLRAKNRELVLSNDRYGIFG